MLFIAFAHQFCTYQYVYNICNIWSILNFLKNHTFKSIIGYFSKLLLKMACLIFENEQLRIWLHNILTTYVHTSVN